MHGIRTPAMYSWDWFCSILSAADLSMSLLHVKITCLLTMAGPIGFKEQDNLHCCDGEVRPNCSQDHWLGSYYHAQGVWLVLTVCLIRSRISTKKALKLNPLLDGWWTTRQSSWLGEKSFQCISKSETRKGRWIERRSISNVLRLSFVSIHA